MAAELILHHYDFSSYSEKVCLVLGLKELSWRSVDIPPVLPKPDYIPLTGGYRRAPALQHVHERTGLVTVHFPRFGYTVRLVSP